jgi:hypothetical protein
MNRYQILRDMKVTRFEDLEIWMLSRDLYKLVFKIISEELFCHDFKFRDQIRSSSGSVSDNIAEGFERGGNKEFNNFCLLPKDHVVKHVISHIEPLIVNIFQMRFWKTFFQGLKLSAGKQLI